MSSCLGIKDLNSLSICLRPSVIGSLGTSLCRGDGWKTFSNDFWGDVPRLLHRWETPQLSAFALHLFLFGLSFYLNRSF